MGTSRGYVFDNELPTLLSLPIKSKILIDGIGRARLAGFGLATIGRNITDDSPRTHQ